MPKHKRSSCLLITAVAALVIARSAESAVLTQYTFPGTSLSATTVAPHVTAGNVNFTGSSASQYTLISNYLAVNAASGANSADAAVSGNSFFQFTLSPEANYSVSLSTLSLAAGYGPTTGAGFVIRSSADNFAANLLSTAIATQYKTLTTYTVDLSGAAFQNLTTGITFRAYTYAGSNPAAAYDDVTLNGTSTVPEPSTWALLGTGVVGWGVVALRRRSAGA